MAVCVGLVLLALSACAADEPSERDADALWAEVQIDGDWVEHYATLREIAMSADLAAVVRIESAEAGRVIQGDAKEDVYCEINLNVEAVDVLHSTSDDTSVRMSLVLPRALSIKKQKESVRAANSALPMENVVMFLRRRSDLPLYRVANGWGIWAKTSRDALDAPLNPERIGDGGLYASDLEGVDTVPELVERVRDLLAAPDPED